jgi:hypothetical protein
MRLVADFDKLVLADGHSRWSRRLTRPVQDQHRQAHSDDDIDTAEGSVLLTRVLSLVTEECEEVLNFYGRQRESVPRELETSLESSPLGMVLPAVFVTFTAMLKNHASTLRSKIDPVITQQLRDFSRALAEFIQVTTAPAALLRAVLRTSSFSFSLSLCARSTCRRIGGGS